MKTVILCGGLGTRLSEETNLKPKPMVEIGGKPILWHVMSIYGSQGFNEFILAAGYKSEYIKEYFLNYYNFQSDLTVHLKSGNVEVDHKSPKDWVVHITDTGQKSMTGGRLFRLRDKLKDGAFMCTYGDGVADVDIRKLLEFHKSHGKLATITAVKPTARFGAMQFDGTSPKVVSFSEKTRMHEGWINGGYFVFEPKVLDYLKNDETILERDPLENLTKDGQLMAYRHEGFWQCMDTVRDKEVLNQLIADKKAPWIKWKE